MVELKVLSPKICQKFRIAKTLFLPSSKCRKYQFLSVLDSLNDDPLTSRTGKKMIQKSSKICWFILKQMTLQLFYYKLIFLFKTFWQKMEHNISFLTKTTSKRMIKMLLTVLTENTWRNFIVRFWQFKFDVGTWKTNLSVTKWKSVRENLQNYIWIENKLFCFMNKILILNIKLAK